MSNIECNYDTVKLLEECDSGSKMAVSSIDEMLGSVNDEELKSYMTESKEHHEKLGDELHEILLECGADDKDPNPIAKGMSWFKTNMKLSRDESDKTVAELITDGCDMGIKSLYEYLHKYSGANDKVKDICKEIIDIEEQLRKDVQKYL